jgi:hypothetical protein
VLDEPRGLWQLQQYAAQAGVTISLQSWFKKGLLQSILRAIGVATLRQRTNDVFTIEHWRSRFIYSWSFQPKDQEAAPVWYCKAQGYQETALFT